MGPKERLQEDLKTAMKANEPARRDTLRLIQAAIRQVEVDKRITMNDDQVYDLLSTEAKKRRDSIAEAQKAGRGDIVEKEQAELALIESYLPQQLSRDELEAEVRQAIAEAGATSAKDMGKVMKVLMPRVKNRADGKLVNDVVKALLPS
ncbi:MAG: GatB/YqeY domain-containing protein [Anaerolineae bacterium]|nr:GatB/YqeY domain-containing protein [Anaerolineae bacterium]